MRTSVYVVVTSNTIPDREDVSSIFPIARFSFPDLILHARNIRARFELSRAWFLSPHLFLAKITHSCIISSITVWYK